MEWDQSIIFQYLIHRIGGFPVILFVSLLNITACSTKPHAIKQTAISIPGANEVYIVRQGLHTGFVVPAGAIQSQLPQLNERFNDTPYLEFGWGDRAYYEADEITSGLTVRAIFWPSESVVRVVAVPERPDIHFADNEVEVLCLDSRQYSLLIGFIEQSFIKDNEGKIIKSKNSADGASQFYKGAGHYYLMNTCNTWTARGLKSAGLNISPSFKLTAGSIMGFLARHNKTQASNSCETFGAMP